MTLSMYYTSTYIRVNVCESERDYESMHVPIGLLYLPALLKPHLPIFIIVWEASTKVRVHDKPHYPLAVRLYPGECSPS